ncbi:MAG: 50S ribosomal protein L11 methyltransferase [bacterium]
MSDEYRRFTLSSSTAQEREWLLAEAFEAGASGAEESEAPGGRFEAVVHARIDRIEAVREAVLGAASAEARIGTAEAVPEIDWSEAWKAGIEALEISSRLVVRPPFVERSLGPGQQEVVIDPGQAFGTGRHASTRLCLDWLAELYDDPASTPRFDRVLDVGTGSGVLALAAVALGAREAFGFDLDPVAIEAAEEAARRNALSDRVRFAVGAIDVALPGGLRWPLVVANLLKRELLPIAHEVAQRLEPDGRLALAGLLAEDAAEVLARFEEEGLREVVARREIVDGTGCWVGLCLG